MLLDFPSPVLTVSPDALKHLEGDGALKSLWYLFTKCKGSLHDGPRLENISWRLWYREMAATGSYRPLTPDSPSSEVTDGPFVLSQACIVSRQPVGQVIYEMLPGSSPNTIQTLNSRLRIPVERKRVVVGTPPVALLPTPAAELSISIIPQESCPVPLSQSPQPAVVAPSSIPGISTTNLVPTSKSAPTTNSSTQSCLSVAGNGVNSRAGPPFFPRVVVVNPTPNPTPHPTPPATPIPTSVSLQLPVTVSVATTDPVSLSSSSQMVPGKLLIPPVHLLQPTPTSSSKSNMLNPNCTSSSSSRTNGLHSTASTQTSPALEEGKSASNPQPGTGTFSASQRAAVLTASEPPQSNSSKPSSLEPIHRNHISDSHLPISPDPSSSSVASFHNWMITTNSSDHLNRAHTTDVTSSSAVPSDNKASSGDSRISIDGNTNKVIAHGNTNGTVKGLPSSPDKTSKRGDAGASSLAPKFFLSSTNASPSPGSGTNGSGGQSSFNSCSASGSSFGRRSDASHSELMSVSPLDGDASQAHQPLTRHQPSRSDGDVAIPDTTGSALSQPYATTSSSSPSSSSHSRTTRRTTAQSNPHHYPYHATHNYGHHTQKDIPRRTSSGKSKSISGSRSRSRNRVHDGLTMTSTAVPVSSISPRTKNTTSTSDTGGTKPRPRRKGSGEGGASITASGRAAGDRGRFARPYGYGIYQVLTQSQNQSNAGPSTQSQKPSQGTQQQAKRMLFRVGNGDDDDDDWEDDDSSSLSRSLSQSQSRSRSRSSRSRRMSSRSPPVLTTANDTQKPQENPTKHVQNGTLSRVSSVPQLPPHTQDTSQHYMQPGPLTESPLPQDTHIHPQPSRQISSATISQHAVAASETSQLADSWQRLSELAIAETNDQRQELKEGVVGAVVGPNGRKIVVIATDEDEDEDDYDDDDDWEEEDDDDDDAGDSKTNNAPTDITRKVSCTTGTNTAASASEVARGSDPVPPGREETDDEGWTSASSVEDEPSNLPKIGTTAKAPTNVATARSDATHGNGTVTDATIQHNNWHSKEKGKQKAPQPLYKSPPRHYPNPPPPQVLQRAQSSKFVGPAGLGFTQHQLPHQTQKNLGARPKETAQPRQHHVEHGHPPSPRQPQHPGVDMSEAALEAQRQLDMFAKKPKRTWSGLARSGSGLLSQLMNPDPEIFPANHPYRRGYSSGDVGMPKGGVARLGIAPNEVTKGGISAAAPPGRNPTAGSRRGDAQIGNMRPQVPGLQPSKGAVALPLADNVTAASVKDNTLGARTRDDQQQRHNRVGSGGYRPKRRPEDQEMEDTDTEEDDQSLEMSKSAAQAKLALVLGRKGAAKQQQQHQRPNIPGRSTTDPTSPQFPPPMQIQRTQSQHVPGPTATTTAPMPLGYPYNLPLAAPPSSPRTTRQLMLRKEMSESLRANLLWSRQLSRTETVGPRRLSSANVSGQGDNNHNHNGIGNGIGNVVNSHNNASEGGGDSNPAPTNVSQFPTLVQLRAKRRPGRGVMVDAVGVGEPSIQEVGWDRPLNPRRKSSAAVPGLRSDQADGEGIHIGGGANVVTRTRSWGGLAGGTGGMTRMF